jgi:sorbitol-specific phosphotransferase system component IIC
MTSAAPEYIHLLVFLVGLKHSYPRAPTYPPFNIYISHSTIMPSFANAVSNFMTAVMGIFTSLLQSVLAVFQSIIALAQNLVTTILGLAQSIVALVLDLTQGVVGFAIGECPCRISGPCAGS